MPGASELSPERFEANVGAVYIPAAQATARIAPRQTALLVKDVAWLFEGSSSIISVTLDVLETVLGADAGLTELAEVGLLGRLS